ncbi:hypothetical protein DEO72_LG3g2978 [Vigna unguiculata]|uniref:Uncharacterized protein n=1 Tax=Vigna unguiculata TaxID=3917 RepID=A0A4D6LIM4_VIGUN|nr:hypothetical protein DEO72_LG3g2978 [Vigna unguiculata]
MPFLSSFAFHLCLYSSNTMAIKKPLNLVFFIFLVSLPFVQSEFKKTTLHFLKVVFRSVKSQTNTQVARFGKEAASSTGTVEDSAREVPTGPDPLHHNNHPIGH